MLASDDINEENSDPFGEGGDWVRGRRWATLESEQIIARALDRNEGVTESNEIFDLLSERNFMFSNDVPELPEWDGLSHQEMMVARNKLHRINQYWEQSNRRSHWLLENMTARCEVLEKQVARTRVMQARSDMVLDETRRELRTVLTAIQGEMHPVDLTTIAQDTLGRDNTRAAMKFIEDKATMNDEDLNNYTAELQDIPLPKFVISNDWEDELKRRIRETTIVGRNIGSFVRIIKRSRDKEEKKRGHHESVQSEEGHFEQMSAITENRDREYRNYMRYREGTMERPKSKFKCITHYVKVNGVKALALFDSGSSVNAVSADFAVVAKLDTFPLQKAIPLQLGCSGSRSMINYGAKADWELGSHRSNCYFDVVNIDHYDIILGVPFLVENKVMLDFQNEAVLMGKDAFMSIPLMEEDVGRSKPKTTRVNRTAAKYEWAKPETQE